MTKEKFNEILSAHEAWLRGELDGSDANLSRADLSGADLNDADLSRANLIGADLSRANLIGADLSDADLIGADLSDANLSGANLIGANLSDANLIGANLSGADLSDADLSGANLIGANLSGADGLLSACNYLDAHFERTADGYIAYKVFGGTYNPPEKWKIEPGGAIEENVNPNRTNACGCGINVAPLAWVKAHYCGTIWKVLIRWEWLPGVIVPYNTDGKIRCERVELVEAIER